MFVAKVKRVVGNPHRTKRRKAVTGRKRSKANPKRRRVLSPKQIKHFGTPAQKAALKRSRAAKRGAKKRKANPVRRARRVARKRPAVRRRKRSTRNPATLITLGFANPRKGNKSVARKRRKARKANSTRKRVVRRRRRSVANPVRRRRRVRRNSTRVVVMSKRRNGRRRSSGRRRNPQFFGHTVPAVQMAKYVAGGLIGVTVVKAGVPMLPSALTNSNAMRAVSSIAVAFAAGWAASRLSPDFGSAVLFGGLMQAGSVVLNMYVPQASQFALSGGRGLGEFVPGAFTVPQNPVILSGPSRIGGAAGRPAVNRAYPRPY